MLYPSGDLYYQLGLPSKDNTYMIPKKYYLLFELQILCSFQSSTHSKLTILLLKRLIFSFQFELQLNKKKKKRTSLSCYLRKYPTDNYKPSCVLTTRTMKRFHKQKSYVKAINVFRAQSWGKDRARTSTMFFHYLKMLYEV